MFEDYKKIVKMIKFMCISSQFFFLMHQRSLTINLENLWEEKEMCVYNLFKNYTGGGGKM